MADLTRERQTSFAKMGLTWLIARKQVIDSLRKQAEGVAPVLALINARPAILRH